MAETNNNSNSQSTPSAADVAQLLGTPTPASQPSSPPPAAAVPSGDIAVQRAQQAMQRTPSQQQQVARPLPDNLLIDQSGGELQTGTPSERGVIPQVTITAPPTPQQTEAATVQQTAVTEGQVAPEAPPTDPIAEMRRQMEEMARANLAQYGLTPTHVLTSAPPAVPAPAPTQQVTAAPAPTNVGYQPPPPLTQSTYQPQFNMRLSTEEHAAALQSPEGMEKLLLRAAQQGYEQGRLATLQNDIPTVNRAMQDEVGKQVEARAFFIENQDLRDYAATVALIAARLRATGKYTDSATLLADTAKEVRLTLRMNGQAVQAANNAIQNAATVAPRPGFAGASAGTTRANGSQQTGQPQKWVGHNLAEDISILSSGLR